jgi:hypothetical protein
MLSISSRWGWYLGKAGKTEINHRLLLKASAVVLSVKTCNLPADYFKT